MSTPRNERTESGTATRHSKVTVRLREMPLDHALRRANFAAVMAHSRAVREQRHQEEPLPELILSAAAG